MNTLILGGSKCGKSAFAEDYVSQIAGEKEKYYLATMIVRDESDEAIVQRHHKLRKGKGFITIEKSSDICAIPPLENEEHASVLMECLSNLLANEMFCKNPLPEEALIKKLSDDIFMFSARVRNMVVMSVNIFEDGCAYDEDSMSYIRALGALNKAVAAYSERVYEVVAGISVRLK